MDEAAVQAEPAAAPETDGTAYARLILKRSGAETENVFVFAAPAIVGRFDPSVGPVDIDLGVVPEGSYVSRKHARFSFADGVWTLEDLGSSNGTYLLKNDFEKIDGTAEIQDGEECAFGNARFVFRAGTGEGEVLPADQILHEPTEQAEDIAEASDVNDA